MDRFLEISAAATEKKLTTVTRVRSDLNLTTETDEYLESVIDTCSDFISAYLSQDSDETGQVTIGRETLQETFWDAASEKELWLGRAPVGDIVSISEDTTAVARQLTGSDGAIAESDATFTSAGASFSSDYVGKAISVVGAGDSGGDLTTSVASVTSETEVELTDAALTTVSGASYTVDNPAFSTGYVVRKQNGRLGKRSAGYPTPFTARQIVVSYTAGWILPGQTGRTLPQDIEDACVLLVRRKLDQLRAGDTSAPGSLIKKESIPGIGTLEYESSGSVDWIDGLPMDVHTLIARYARPSVSV